MGSARMGRQHVQPTARILLLSGGRQQQNPEIEQFSGTARKLMCRSRVGGYNHFTTPVTLGANGS
jgi:hypothetical protein